MFTHPTHEKEYQEFVQQLRPLRQRKEIGQSLNEFTMNETIYRKLLAFAYAFCGVENFLKQKQSRRLFKINVRNTKRPPLEFHPLRMDYDKLSLQEISLLDLITYFLRQSTAIDTALAYPFPLYRLAYLDEREFILFAYAWKLAAGHQDFKPIDLKMTIPRDKLWDQLFEESAKDLVAAKDALELQIRNKTEHKNGFLNKPHKEYQITIEQDTMQRVLQAATYLRYHQKQNLDQWASYLLTKFPFAMDYEKLGLLAAIFNEIPKMIISLAEEEYPVVVQALAHVFQIPVKDDVVDDVVVVDTSSVKP